LIQDAHREQEHRVVTASILYGLAQVAELETAELPESKSSCLPSRHLHERQQSVHTVHPAPQRSCDRKSHRTLAAPQVQNPGLCPGQAPFP
jgi:hypothetical protein